MKLVSTNISAVSGLNYRVLVLDELISSLQRLAEGVAAYVSSPDNELVLPALKEHVGEISRTLSLIEIKGGVMLSAELEDLMIDVGSQNRNLEDTAVVMVRAVEQLEEYLTYIKSGSADIPFVLLPLLNELRAVRNAPLLSEAVMLLPDFVNSSVVVDGALSRASEKAFRGEVKLARAPLMKCLLKWYRGKDLDESFVEIATILASLQKAATGTDLARLWKVARGVIQSLLDGGLQPAIAHKLLFGQVERFLQHLMAFKNKAIYQLTPTELFKNLLYYVALSESENKLVQQLKSGYQLEDILPTQESRDHAIHAMEGPSLKMLEAAGDEVRDELAYVKTTIEVFAHADKPDSQSLQELPDRLKKISRTLQLLGMDKVVTSCIDVLAMVRTVCDKPSEAKHELMGIAESILRVESGLGEYIHSREPLSMYGQDAVPVTRDTADDYQTDKLLNSVLAESMRTLERVKEEWMRARDGVNPTAQQGSMVHLLTETSGVLQILPMPELALLFRDLATYTSGLDAQGIAELPAEIHNSYADVVSNLEVYIELHLQGQPVMTDLLARSAGALDTLESYGVVLEGVLDRPAEKSDVVKQLEVPKTVKPTDSKMLGVFIEEAMDQFNVISDSMIVLRQGLHDKVAQKNIRRAYHTIKGSGRMVGVGQLSEFAWSNENLLNKIIDTGAEPDESVLQHLEQSLAALPQLVDALHGASEQVEGIDELNTSAFALVERFYSTEPLFTNKPKTLSDIEKADISAAAISMDSAATSLANETLDTTHITESDDLDNTDPDNMELTQTLDVTGLDEASQTLRLPTMEQAETMELEGSEDAASHGLFEPIESVEGPVITRLDASADSSPNDSIKAYSDDLIDPILFEIFKKECAQHIKTLKEVIGKSSEIEPNNRMVRAFHTLSGSAQTARVDTLASLLGPVEHAVKRKLRSGERFSEGETLYLTEVIEAVELKLQAISDNEPEPAFVADVEARLPEFTERVLAETEAQNRPVQLGELQSVFIEEAEDIVENLQQLILRWSGNPRSRDIGMDVQSLLHTLKGSARVASYAGIADLAHAMEDAVQRWTDSDGDIELEVLDVLKDANEAIAINLEQAKAGDAPGYFDWLVNELRSIRADIHVDASGQEPVTNVLASKTDLDDAAASSFAESESATPKSPDRIRLDTGILERLTDMVNEGSVHHSQLMLHQAKIGESLGELDHTINRLRQQLRELDIESEIHISAEDKSTATKGFDALELDKYGKVQEISRAILESFSDLDDIRYSMSVNLRNSEADMTEQARINGVVQETLGQVRMVRFASIESRLRQVVSDAGRACAKAVNLKFEGDDNAIDRKVLKHITTPLEHLLRNAVAHGIESSEQRGDIDKEIVGSVTVRLVLDEGDILLDISDDGRGIDVEKVRERALSESLIGAASSLNDQSLLDLLMKPGFTTTESVSQISGRGVGLEAVRRELRKIGGALTMQSKPGLGTTFKIRIPQAQFVNQVLLLSAADQVVAVAANRVQGVNRITEAERKRFSDNRALRVEFKEHACRIVSLNALLGLPEDNFVDSASLVFVSAAGEVIALLVKDVPGHQEAIVKPVGRQVAALGVYSGACVQPDGTVAPVLDLSAVIAKHYSSGAKNDAVSSELEDLVVPVKRKSVLVVDDSITMRKYVERALLRENYLPILARNGVEAMSLMRQQKPDIILTDLEMPQMDGFELVAMVKDHAGLKDIPIVVISSRSGQKHRKKLAKAGVNGFLGKPYQEAELLNLLVSLE